MSILANIQSPADLQALSSAQLDELCHEIRKRILNVVSANGGHLAPNLGTVELTVALEKAYGAKHIPIVWDVGHQTYTHKLLTGRNCDFDQLRQLNGVSGFLSPAESEHDLFYSGHAGVALSEALGLAMAQHLDPSKGNIVVAVIGDGALANGITLEALNNLRNLNSKLIIVINDNGMSISRSVGAMSKYLNYMITSYGYNRIKDMSKGILSHLPGGHRCIRAVEHITRAIKRYFSSSKFAGMLDLKYVGPIDGHNVNEMVHTFEKLLKIQNNRIAVHIITTKGYGCQFAMEHPDHYHGTSAFDPQNGSLISKQCMTFSKSFSECMCRLADNDQRIIAITAAMAEGTGLLKFQQRFPTRFFDVGIAEEHAVVFASGLAKSGLRPVIAMYGTFLQRALDCVYHDICLQNLPVIICVDRAGAVEDGASHHGIWDLGFARQLPNLSILFPADWSELDMMLTEAIKISAPVMIRYPRGSAESTTSAKHPIIWGKAIDEQYDENATISIWGCGREVMTAIKTSALLKEKYGLLANVVNPRFIRPFDITRIMQDVKAKRHIVSIEDNCLSGGMASVIDEILINTDHLPIQHFGWKSGTILPFGNLQDIRNQQGLTAEKIAEAIAEKCMQ